LQAVYNSSILLSSTRLRMLPANKKTFLSQKQNSILLNMRD